MSEMNKVGKLLEDIEKYREKKEAQIKKIQKGCKHKNTKRWSDYSGINELCSDCLYFLR
jgi:hypothetical protein